MPLWTPYERLIESKFADINNASESGFAGSILAALFLRRFVERAKPHLHMDIFGWTPAAEAGSALRRGSAGHQGTIRRAQKSLRSMINLGCRAGPLGARMKRLRNDLAGELMRNVNAGKALKLWHDVNLHLVHDREPDLSPRQMSILLTIYLEAPPHTVRELAKKLGVTKPVVTRALNAMGKFDLLGRRRDET